MKSVPSVEKSARVYIGKGWRVVPTPSGKKAPIIPDWQKLRIDKSEVDYYFKGQCNIGVILGKPSNNLVDVDHDCDEARRLAPNFLPATGRIHGRKSSPASHWWYYTKSPLKTEKFIFRGKCLLEARSTGCQTVIPPSKHPSGERLRWEAKGAVAQVGAEELLRSVRRLAAASLLVRQYPPTGSRNKFALALAGMLHRAGWEQTEIEDFVDSVARAADDEEWDDRKTAPKSTAKRIEKGDTATGRPRLSELIGKDVVDQACEWLGIYGLTATVGKRGESHSTRLVTLAAGARLLHTPDNEAYASIQVGGHTETLRLKDPDFKRWLAGRYYDEFGTAPSTNALSDAIAVLEGQAMFGSREEKVFTRLGEFKGALYLDLCRPDWKAVKITADGWKVVTNPRVKFRRPPGMKALPIPRRGGSIQELRPFINVLSDGNFKLMVGWLIGALNPRGPYPILVLQGEAGSAKSTTARVLRELIDPNTAPLRSAPRDERDLVIAAKNSRCIAFDNLSYISLWQSDALCRIATGSGFATRRLYSDDQEQIFKVSRPVLLNGIDGIVSRGDLMDRSMILYLPAIPAALRISEKQFWRRFRKAQPVILGALLEALVCTVKRIGKVHLSSQPRMADFARWVTAAERRVD